MVVVEADASDEQPTETSPIIVVATAFIVLVIVAAYAVLFHTLSATIANRIFGVSLLIMLLTGGWMYRLRKLTQQAAAWEHTADALGLRCKTVGKPWNMQVVVEGVCRGRYVQLSISRDTQGRLPVTCVDMDLACVTDARFRIWGPFSEADVAEFGHRREFQKAKRYGTTKSYFAFSNAPHLSANLFPPQVWSRLQAIDHPINISLVGQTLSFEQPGITYHSHELIEYVELLNQIAYIVAEWEMRCRQDALQMQEMASGLAMNPAV